MKQFTCDNCGRSFSHALDIELYKDSHGNLTEYDLCAPCRGLLKNESDKPKDSFFDKINKKKK